MFFLHIILKKEVITLLTLALAQYTNYETKKATNIPPIIVKDIKENNNSNNSANTQDLIKIAIEVCALK